MQKHHDWVEGGVDRAVEKRERTIIVGQKTDWETIVKGFVIMIMWLRWRGVSTSMQKIRRIYVGT